MGHALPLECVDRLKSKNIEMEDFTIHASTNPSYDGEDLFTYHALY